MSRFIERYSSLIAWLAGLGIPIAVIIAGWLITSAVENSKRDSEYVQIAISILNVRDKKAEEMKVPFTDDEMALRQWAVRLLNRKAPEKFTETEQKALLAIQRPFGDLDLSSMIIGGLFVKALLDSVAPTPTPTPQPERLPGPTK